MDNRRRRYVPISVYFGHDETSTHLKEKFGGAGLTVWVCVLAAAKRSQVREGIFTYVTEEGGWTELGLGHPHTPDFTLAEFFRATGRIKQTRKTRRGDVTEITLTRWKDWNQAWNRQSEAEQKSRKRDENTPPLHQHSTDDPPPKPWTEVEVERELETGSTPSTANERDTEGAQREAERIVGACRDADEGSLGVVLSLARQLSEGSLAKVRESCEHLHPGVGYAVNALKSELRERAA